MNEKITLNPGKQTKLIKSLKIKRIQCYAHADDAPDNTINEFKSIVTEARSYTDESSSTPSAEEIAHMDLDYSRVTIANNTYDSDMSCNIFMNDIYGENHVASVTSGSVMVSMPESLIELSIVDIY